MTDYFSCHRKCPPFKVSNSVSVFITLRKSTYLLFRMPQHLSESVLLIVPIKYYFFTNLFLLHSSDFIPATLVVPFPIFTSQSHCFLFFHSSSPSSTTLTMSALHILSLPVILTCPVNLFDASMSCTVHALDYLFQCRGHKIPFSCFICVVKCSIPCTNTSKLP